MAITLTQKKEYNARTECLTEKEKTWADQPCLFVGPDPRWTNTKPIVNFRNL